MCALSLDLENKMTDTVEQFLRDCRMFTGYDVTKVTREREQIHLRHQDVRGEIHELPVVRDALDYGYQMNGQVVSWLRSRLDFADGTWAFVYHPSHLRPQDYHQSQPQPQAPPMAAGRSQGAVASFSVADPVADSGGRQDDGSFAADYRHRLLVPTRYLKEAGLVAGDSVFVISDPSTSSVVLTKDSHVGVAMGPGIKVTTQIVERNGDVRLSTRTLKAAELENASYKIDTEDQGQTRVVKVSRN